MPFSGLFKIAFNFLGFMQGSFDVREVGQPPKVGIFSEMENTMQRGFPGLIKISQVYIFLVEGCCWEVRM